MNQKDEYFVLVWGEKRKKRKCSDDFEKSFKKLFKDSEDCVNMPLHLHFSIQKFFKYFYLEYKSGLLPHFEVFYFGKTSALHDISILNIIFDQVSLVEKEFG